ncbi:hypothetical protein Rhe02_49660 [Rhizocola hellebori]|uniref:Uncharacterized protein n=1 Tax=Rhizocola hellebori TaxID=1392758 RepID=A0A8J3QA30_9ACTN|nr:hypothetical protein [Rhizocola hellebori]GIH06899.1 hypothetical protein Rhe02_49660 [Rhizocola hellebori]
MIDLTDEVRRSLTDLADRARPVLLGDAAIRRVRERRKRRRVSAVAACIAVLVMLVPAWWARNGARPEPPTSTPAEVTPSPPSLPTHVLTAFAGSGGAWQVLNPETGQYFRAPQGTTAVAVSADLRTAVVLTGTGRLGIAPTTGDAEPDWVDLPQATEYSSVSISYDGERIAVPLWAQPVAGRAVFRRYAVVDIDSLRLSVVQIQQTRETEATSLSWQGSRLLISMFAARLFTGQPDPGPAQLLYAAMDPDTGTLSDFTAVPARTGPVYPWRHQLVRDNSVVVQADINGRHAFAISRLVGDSLVRGPIQLKVPLAVSARAVGWDVVTDTIIVEIGGPPGTNLVAVQVRTGEQRQLLVPIPAEATYLVLGNGDALGPGAAYLRFSV